MLRNLAHEIKNPLGGLRGSAQLLERELERPELKEYTQVIIKEADRLQVLLDRLLTPRRAVQLSQLNIHEVLERVRSLVQAEFPNGISVLRNYDPSVPDLVGDIEQLIQAVLNVVRNAAQALLSGANAGRGGAIVLRTRTVRQVTIARQRHKLALELQVIDDGPGVPGDIRDRVFNPLVSVGRGRVSASRWCRLVQNHGGGRVRHARDNRSHIVAAGMNRLVGDERSIRWVSRRRSTRGDLDNRSLGARGARRLSGGPPLC